MAIIGAGPAGLTAGYLLSKAGKSVFVAEKDPDNVGGISRTVEHAGYRFDIGGHRFFSKSREVVALRDEPLPDGFLARPRMSRIYYGGKFYSVRALAHVAAAGGADIRTMGDEPVRPSSLTRDSPQSAGQERRRRCDPRATRRPACDGPRCSRFRSSSSPVHNSVSRARARKLPRVRLILAAFRALA